MKISSSIIVLFSPFFWMSAQGSLVESQQDSQKNFHASRRRTEHSGSTTRSWVCHVDKLNVQQTSGGGFFDEDLFEEEWRIESGRVCPEDGSFVAPVPANLASSECALDGGWSFTGDCNPPTGRGFDPNGFYGCWFNHPKFYWCVNQEDYMTTAKDHSYEIDFTIFESDTFGKDGQIDFAAVSTITLPAGQEEETLVAQGF